jgi:hypothetical protein
MLSVSGLCIVDERMINKRIAIGGMKISMETNYSEQIRRNNTMWIKIDTIADIGSNPCQHDLSHVTNGLSYNMATTERINRNSTRIKWIDGLMCWG